MKKILLAACLWAAPLSAQSPAQFFQQAAGFWKQLPPKGVNPELIEESYFEFLPNGEFYVAINGGTVEKPVIVETGRGKINLLKGGDPVTVEIVLNDELSTNTIALKNNHLTIYAFHEKTRSPVEKIVMEKAQRP